MANIGYPNTKNKKKSSLSLGTPFFKTTKEQIEEDKKKLLARNESISGKDAETVARNRAQLAKNAKLGLEHAEWQAKKPGAKKKVNTTTKTTTSKGGLNKQGVYVKKGGKATGKIKDYAHGSKARYDEYEARGWAHDASTKGYTKVDEAKTKVKESKKAVKTARKSTVVKDAIQAGKDTRKATRLTARAAKKQKKADKITAKKQKRADEITERGGTRVGVGLRKVGSKIKNVFKSKKKKKEDKDKDKK